MQGSALESDHIAKIEQIDLLLLSLLGHLAELCLFIDNFALGFVTARQGYFCVGSRLGILTR